MDTERGRQVGVKVSGAHFADAPGRQVLLHGINVVNKDPAAGFVFDQDPQLYIKLRAWGLNVVRLGVIWEGLEPEPGVFDEDYLRRLDRQIAWASEAGLWVFLDMHQDLYSSLYSDGAPAWATLTGGAPHVDLGGVWSDAYFTSPAVQAALDSFWANAPAPDGVGVQDHYARAWAYLAQRYRADPAVIGYDLMNEPFPGSAAVSAQGLMFAKGAELLSGLENARGAGEPGPAGVRAQAEALAEKWLSTEGRSELLAALRDVAIYRQVVDATEPLYAAFDRTQLKAMYHRVAAAIREVDPATNSRALFLETTMGSNMGVYSAIEPVVLEGTRDPAQVYAPHGYDLVVDTPDIAAASPERVALIFERHAETGQRLGLPMLVGEWGAYGRNPGTLPAAWHVVHQFETALCSETYWAYEPGIEAFPCFPAIQRPYPERVAGTLVSYHYDPGRRTFTVTWDEDGRVTAPTCIYLPGWLVARGMTVDPPAVAISVERVAPSEDGSRFLEIAPTGTAGRRTVTIAA